MTIRALALPLLLLVAVGDPAAAEPDRLQLSGAIRTRFETIDGQARAGFNSSDDLLNFRTTLRAEYDAAPIKLVAELWDSRVYGGNRRTPVTANEVNALELVQAYAEAKLLDRGGTTLTTQAGRLMINLGSRRLIAADDYRNTTSGYTGLRADLATKSGWHATALYTLPQTRLPEDLDGVLDNEVAFDRESFDLVIWGGLVSRAKAINGATAEISFFHFGERDRPGRPTRDRSLDTVALRLIRDPAPGRLDFEAEAIAQRGHAAPGLAQTSHRQQVRAWFVHADMGYTFDSPWRPRLSIDYDHASGDGRGPRFARFDTLFGMRRADFAPSGLYSAIGRSNLVSPGVRLEAVPNRRTEWFVSYRPLWLASRTDAFATTGVRDAAGRSGSFAGHQIDARLRHQPAPWLRLEADVALLAKGRFLREAPNAPPGRRTRYLSLNATTTF